MRDHLAPSVGGFKLPAITVVPGKESITIYTEITGDRIGILADISKEITERKFNLINGVLRVEQGRGFVLLVAESTGGTPIEDLREALSEVEGLGEASCEKSIVPGSVISTKLFPLTRDGVRCTALGEAGLKALVENLSGMIGEGAFNALPFGIGYEMGKGFAETYLEIARRSGPGDPVDAIKFVMGRMFAASGWARAQLEVGERTIKVVLSDSLEAVASGRSGEPSCCFTKGVLAGALTRMLRVPVGVTGVKCRAAGDDHRVLSVIYA